MSKGTEKNVVAATDEQGIVVYEVMIATTKGNGRGPKTSAGLCRSKSVAQKFIDDLTDEQRPHASIVERHVCGSVKQLQESAREAALAKLPAKYRALI